MGNKNFEKIIRPGTLRVGGALTIISTLKILGQDPEQVMAEAGVNARLFDDPDNLITYSLRGRLMKHCVAKTGCRHFGLLVGQQMDLHSLGLLGLLMRSLPDAGAALQTLVDRLHLHSQGALTALHIDGELARVTYEAVEPGVEATDQTGDGAVAMMLNVMRSMCGPKFKPIEASFAHRTPADIKPFREFFHTPLYFNAEHYSLVFSSTWLKAPLPHADPEFQKLLINQMKAADAGQQAELPEQLRNVLRTSLTAGQCSEDKIAALFSLSPRTLSRRLASFGTSFHKLADEARLEIARQMLEQTSLPVGEIATSLHYTRSSAFIRAFKRWSGSTPASWRASHSVQFK